MATTIETLKSDPLVASVTAYATAYMQNYDSSHDWAHIQRVVGLAHHLYEKAPNKDSLDLRTIHLAALLHDVGDRKYIKPTEDPTNIISSLLLSFSSSTSPVTPEFASKIQKICQGVSFSSEVKNGTDHVLSLISEHPELAIVQDADRLDAIGGVGIARMFTFGGAKKARSLQASVDHIDEKLIKLGGMMKTEEGKRLARERTRRLEVLKGWWDEETAFAKGVEGVWGE
ncbi:hypothetical protein QBC35DRAFT_62181 [Podospora australis]|uniref:HD/PDEase domain-containing protein n=1 Tax=Podospora australis TaxID=1536484 RepID=A0AAN7AMA2_9PEZI|nr:hypothetical protein QBC35DRAFT_62181 [Podospora australis]